MFHHNNLWKRTNDMRSKKPYQQQYCILSNCNLWTTYFQTFFPCWWTFTINRLNGQFLKKYEMACLPWIWPLGSHWSWEGLLYWVGIIFTMRQCTSVGSAKIVKCRQMSVCFPRRYNVAPGMFTNPTALRNVIPRYDSVAIV